MHLGFSYVGALYLAMLFVPNLLWTRHKPQGYEQYAAHENKLLLALERAGEFLVCPLVLIFSDFDLPAQGLSGWCVWLALSFGLMLLYEVFWLRYFRSGHTMRDFYGSLLGIPVAGATLPVAAFLLLAVYGKNPLLFTAAALLGVGHIGIHLQHRKELRQECMPQSTAAHK